MDNGTLKGMDLALALRAGANYLVNASQGGDVPQPQYSIFIELGYAIEVIAESLERQCANANETNRVVRSEKAPGDVIIGSVCDHDWHLVSQETYRQACRKCHEVHEDLCPALSGGKCDCEAPQPIV